MSEELNATMEEMRVATEKLNSATETVLEVKGEIAELLSVEQVDAETIDSCNKRFQTLKTTVPQTLAELKKLTQQASRIRTPGAELKEAISQANSLLTETQADFEKLKSHMQATSTSWTGVCNLAEEIFEAVSSNMASLRQSVYLKLPIASTGDLKTRLAGLKGLVKDCDYAIEALANKSAESRTFKCAPTDFGLAPLSDKVRHFLTQSRGLPVCTTESKMQEVEEAFQTYAEWLARAVDEVTAILQSAESWLINANQLEGQLRVSSSELESEAARPSPSLNFSADTQDTARDLGLARVRSLAQKVLTSHSDSLEGLQRTAESRLTDSGFNLSNI
ncbi:unnamed protein product, partial [Dibothriocephalus latus]